MTDLGPLPEVKTLVYFGSGLRLNGTDNLAQMRATVNAAVRANVTLNPIDARGLVASAPMGDATQASPGGVGMFNGTIAAAAITRGQQSQDTLYALAKDTGGRAMFDNNDLALGIAQAAQAVTGYYILGYYTTNRGEGRALSPRERRSRAEPRRPICVPAGLLRRQGVQHVQRGRQGAAAGGGAEARGSDHGHPDGLAVNYFQINRAEDFVPVSVRMPGSELSAGGSAGASHVDIDMIGEIKDEHGVTYRNVRDLVRVPIEGRRRRRVV